MNAVTMLARNEVRRRRLYVAGVTLLVAVVGTVVLASAAGARRSDAALRRFNAFSRTSDLEVDVQNPSAAELQALRNTPNVVAVAVIHAYAITVVRSSNVSIAAATDDTLGTLVDRSRTIVGRQADPNAVNEITISESLSHELHLGLGGHLDCETMTPTQFKKLVVGQDPGAPVGPRLRLDVVGIVRRPLDLGDRQGSGGVVVLTPAFDHAYGHRIGLFNTVLRVRTRHGEPDVLAVSAVARQIFDTKPNTFFELVDLAQEGKGAQDAIDVLTLAFWIFGGVVALAGMVAIGIVVSREISQGGTDQDTLRALGLTRRQRAAAIGVRALPIALAGAVLAVVGAIAVSPLLPTGIARRADIDPGFHADWLVLGTGLAGVALFVTIVAAVAAVRTSGQLGVDQPAMGRNRGRTVYAIAGGAGVSPTIANGLRMAFQRGRGRASVPVRSAFLGAAFGVFGITSVLVFGSSLQHTATTPRLYGWTFDFKAPDNTFANGCNRKDLGLERQPGVGDVGVVCFDTTQVDNRPVTGWGFGGLRGTVQPEILEGRAPAANDEVALGSATLRALHKKIGDVVSARGPGAARRYRIVGRAVFPRLMTSDIQPLDDGAAFTLGGMNPILDSSNSSRYMVGRFAPGANHAAVLQRLDTVKDFQVTSADSAFTNDSGAALAVTPPEIERLRQIGWFAPALTALLGTLALAALGHALVASTRRRRRELALLKTLGFDRRQVRATVAWQASALVVVGLVIGIPAGLLLGDQIWRLVASSLGVSSAATVPAAALALIALAALVLANLVAFFPARRGKGPTRDSAARVT